LLKFIRHLVNICIQKLVVAFDESSVKNPDFRLD